MSAGGDVLVGHLHQFGVTTVVSPEIPLDRIYFVQTSVQFIVHAEMPGVVNLMLSVRVLGCLTLDGE